MLNINSDSILLSLKNDSHICLWYVPILSSNALPPRPIYQHLTFFMGADPQKNMMIA